MGLSDFIKDKINDSKKSVIKSKAKSAIKEKIDIGDHLDKVITVGSQLV
ncbi:hypothetical protein [Endozoicomonas elysicola]|nr:hypothetical protein [Endozoicomonas elysicola]